MKIKCQVTWTRLGSGNNQPAIRVKYGNNLVSDWIEVDKAPALMQNIELEEEILHERPKDGKCQFVKFQNG